MKILVTGGAGFIGSAIADLLAEDPASLAGLKPHASCSAVIERAATVAA